MEQKSTQQLKGHEQKKDLGTIVRIMATDIPGEKKVYVGLTRIRGISFGFSNALCKTLKIDKNKRIVELSQEEIKKITSFFDFSKMPRFLMNRRNDLDSGEDKHLFATNLELRKEFDIKRFKKIRSYKGVRHARNLPVRGQRTKSHFRTRSKNRVIGVKRKFVGKKG